jgi:hypothetical protein
VGQDRQSIVDLQEKVDRRRHLELTGKLIEEVKDLVQEQKAATRALHAVAKALDARFGTLN